MGYGESDSSGAWLKFQIHPEDLEKFRGLKGTVFHLTMVKIQDSGEPEKQEKPYADRPIGELCRQALDAAEDTEWHIFLKDNSPITMERLTPYFAAKSIKSACAVSTRKALDYDQDAAIRWGKLCDKFYKWKHKTAAGL